MHYHPTVAITRKPARSVRVRGRAGSNIEHPVAVARREPFDKRALGQFHAMLVHPVPVALVETERFLGAEIAVAAVSYAAISTSTSSTRPRSRLKKSGRDMAARTRSASRAASLSGTTTTPAVRSRVRCSRRVRRPVFGRPGGLVWSGFIAASYG
jgi:hypothetical protein